MDEKNLKAFNAAINFVNDLWSVFGEPTKVTPLALYRRLIQHIKFTDSEAIQKVLDGFQTFLSTYESSILGNKLDSIPRGTNILFSKSKKAYIEIQKFIFKSKNDKDTREAIRSHLVTISAILEPNKKKLAELDTVCSARKVQYENLKVDTGTKEGAFISGIMDKAKKTFEDPENGAAIDNPAQAMMAMMGSGLIQDMFLGLQEGVGSGEMDMYKLMGTVQGMISTFMPSPPPPSSGESTPSSEGKISPSSSKCEPIIEEVE